MVLTSRTQTLLFNNNAVAVSGGLVRLPLSVVPHYETRCHVTGTIIPATNKPLFRPNLWSSDEHERFLHGLELFPNGPWKEVAKIVGTKTTRQTMTHAQKYRQKIERHMQGKAKKSAKDCRRNQQQSMAAISAPVKQLENVNISFVDELLADEPMPTVSSPTEVYTDAFDTSFLDHEFDSLLASIESQACGDGWSVFA